LSSHWRWHWQWNAQLCGEGHQESEAEEELDQGTQQQRRHLPFDRLRFGLVGWLVGWLASLFTGVSLLNPVDLFFSSMAIGFLIFG
jgi:hypothetical protein